MQGSRSPTDLVVQAEGGREYLARVMREGIGFNRLHLDDAGIAVARFLSRSSAVNKNDTLAAFLQRKRRTHTDHAGPKNNAIRQERDLQIDAMIDALGFRGRPQNPTPARVLLR